MKSPGGMRHVTVYQVDAFTSTPLAGNPAGVVLDADALSDIEMQSIAREMNLSETAFVRSSPDDAHDMHVRYFTPHTEVPVCGHATIAAHVVNAQYRKPGRRTLRMLTGAGSLTVEVLGDEDEFQVRMAQARPQFQAALEDATVDRVLAALRVTREAILENAPLQVVSTGHSKILVPFRRRSDVDGLQPDFGALAALSAEIGSNGYFAFTLDTPPRSALTYGRMFAPAIGILEDPVTGNASGPLGAYLVQHALVSASATGRFSFLAAQGDAVNRPGQMRVEVDIENSCPTGVAISGTAVIVLEARLRIS